MTDESETAHKDRPLTSVGAGDRSRRYRIACILFDNLTGRHTSETPGVDWIGYDKGDRWMLARNLARLVDEALDDCS